MQGIFISRLQTERKLDVAHVDVILTNQHESKSTSTYYYKIRCCVWKDANQLAGNYFKFEIKKFRFLTRFKSIDRNKLPAGGRTQHTLDFRNLTLSLGIKVWI